MLTHAQTRATRDELLANLDLSGLDRESLGAAVGFDPERLDRTLQMRKADPSDVWLLRDFLDQVIRDRGRTPRPWTVLINHDIARQWFTIYPTPPTPPDDGVAQQEG